MSDQTANVREYMQGIERMLSARASGDRKSEGEAMDDLDSIWFACNSSELDEIKIQMEMVRARLAKESANG